jgi:hypothetical protein
MKRLALLALVAAGCTAQNAYIYPPAVQQRYLITMGDAQRPYQSMGYIQITRRGAYMAGFIPVVDADMQKMFGEILIGEIQKAGADGIINLHFYETQYTPATRAIFVLFFFIPLPTVVEVSGELIRFVDAPPPPPPPGGYPSPVQQPPPPG